jgi:hypothetical protein
VRRNLLVVILVALAAAGGVAAITIPALNQVSTGTKSTTTTAPPGCVKPAGGFLIIASQDGYNDSVDHGVPKNSWPVMNVTLGQNVTIVVCNEDPTQTHGFNINYYYDDQIVSVGSGQMLKVNFVANKVGQFRVYCNIFCTVHWAMQSGLLVVS